MNQGRSEWSAPLGPGQPVVLDDGSVGFIHSIQHGWVQLVDASGKTITMLPTIAVAQLLMTAENAPPDNPRASDLEERVKPKARRKAEESFAIVRLVETGLRMDQDDEEVPPDELNPVLVPMERNRVSAVARLLTPIWKIDYKSARRRVQRIMENAPQGLAGFVDARLTKPTRDRQHPDMQWWVQQWLVARLELTTIHGATMYLTFRVWLAANQPDVDCPAERTFARICDRIYEEQPELSPKWSKKTQLSAAKKPKVSHAPRKATRPGELWLADTTTVNIILRDPYNRPDRDQTFRVEKTKIIDACTRLVVGRAIAESTTGFSIGLALADAFASMIDPRQTITIDARTYPRPFVGLPKALCRFPIAPRRLLMDNGKPWLSHYVIWQLQRLGIDVEPARVRDPRAKAEIERSFLSDLSMMEEFQPGFIGGSIHGRGPAAEETVVLTWEEYWARDSEWTDLWNFREHRGLKSTTGRSVSPYQLWAEGASQLGTIEVPVWENEWIRFLPFFTQKISPYGVVHNGLIFNAPILEALTKVPAAAPGGKYRFHCDPTDLRQIYCFDSEGNTFELPWVMRTEDTPHFGEHSLKMLKADQGDATLSVREYQDLMVHLLIKWQDDNVSAASRWALSSRNEDMQNAALIDLRSLDTGVVVTADTYEILLPPYDWQPDLTGDDADDLDGDLFASFG